MSIQADDPEQSVWLCLESQSPQPAREYRKFADLLLDLFAYLEGVTSVEDAYVMAPDSAWLVKTSSRAQRGYSTLGEHLLTSAQSAR